MTTFGALSNPNLEAMHNDSLLVMFHDPRRFHGCARSDPNRQDAADRFQPPSSTVVVDVVVVVDGVGDGVGVGSFFSRKVVAVAVAVAVYVNDYDYVYVYVYVTSTSTTAGRGVFAREMRTRAPRSILETDPKERGSEQPENG